MRHEVQSEDWAKQWAANNHPALMHPESSACSLFCGYSMLMLSQICACVCQRLSVCVCVFVRVCMRACCVSSCPFQYVFLNVVSKFSFSWSCSTQVPILLHADEGQSTKKRAIWIISWSSPLVHEDSWDSMWLFTVSVFRVQSEMMTMRFVLKFATAWASIVLRGHSLTHRWLISKPIFLIHGTKVFPNWLSAKAGDRNMSLDSLLDCFAEDPYLFYKFRKGMRLQRASTGILSMQLMLEMS